jgi:hypothetical protein
LSYDVVRWRISRLSRRLAKLGGLAGVLATVLLLLLWGKAGPGPRGGHRDEVAMPGEIGPDAVATRPAASSVASARERAERAARLRARGLEECGAGRYRECVEALDGARGIDPAGDGEERVKEARRVAEEALGRAAPGEDEKKRR